MDPPDHLPDNKTYESKTKIVVFYSLIIGWFDEQNAYLFVCVFIFVCLIVDDNLFLSVGNDEGTTSQQVMEPRPLTWIQNLN